MEIKQNFDLTNYNTFGVRSKAEMCSIISSIEDIQKVIEQNRTVKKEIYPLGSGSNILLTQDIDKWVLINQLKGIKVLKESEKDVILEVMSGEDWNEFVLYTLEQGFYGLENLSLIPGLVGTSPIQNIGAYGVEVKDFIDSVEFIYLESGNTQELDNRSIRFGYRDSIFKNELKGKIFITKVRFTLQKDSKVNVKYKALIDELEKRSIKDPSPKDISDAVIAVRQSKLPDPAKIGNSGSFFKNPIVDISVLENLKERFENVPNYPANEGKVKLAAGWLIEKGGWKGFRDGDVGVHAKQALVLVNYGNGKGVEILRLSDKIIADIEAKFGISLEREVNII